MNTSAEPISVNRFHWVWGAYAAAALIAAACLCWLPALASGSLLSRAAWADVVATLVVFAFSVGHRNSSFYDPYWSVVPPLLLVYWVWSGFALLLPGAQLRVLLVAVLVGWWAVRLTQNWARGWGGLHDEDWRYQDLQRSLGPWYWPVSLLGIHLMPTVWVFLGCLGLYVVSGAALADGLGWLPGSTSAPAALGWLDLVAALVGTAAVWVEMRADAQLRQFRAQRHSRSELLRTGVWAWCRHPNYLGEIGFWLALALFGAAAAPAAWWVWLGPLVMLLLFVGITIRMIEQKLAPAKPGYAAYQADTPMLIPWPRPRRS